MNSAVENIFLKDHLTPGDLKIVEDACRQDAALANLVHHWIAVTRHVRSSLETDLPSAKALVLYALRTQENDHLSPEEQDELSEVESRIASAIADHPALGAIVHRIHSDAAEFDAIWTERTSASPKRITTQATRRIEARVGLVGRLRHSIGLNPGWYGLATALALLVASLVIFQQRSATGPGLVIGTPVGKTNVVSLPDGSKVRLTDGSTITLQSLETFNRQLTLRGNAFFDITPADVQFQITTENARVSVYGTSFGVSTGAETEITEVALVSGSVSLSSLAANRFVRLEPGQLSRVVGANPPSDPQRVDLENALSWTDLFIFKDTPLPDVSSRLADRFAKTILVDEALNNRTVTGTFAPEQGLESILDAIVAALNVSLITEDGGGPFRIVAGS